MYFVHTNAIETIVGVDTVFHPGKMNIAEKLTFGELLRYIVDHIKHIQVSLYIHIQSRPLWE